MAIATTKAEIGAFFKLGPLGSEGRGAEGK